MRRKLKSGESFRERDPSCSACEALWRPGAFAAVPGGTGGGKKRRADFFGAARNRDAGPPTKMPPSREAGGQVSDRVRGDGDEEAMSGRETNS